MSVFFRRAGADRRAVPCRDRVQRNGVLDNARKLQTRRWRGRALLAVSSCLPLGIFASNERVGRGCVLILRSDECRDADEMSDERHTQPQRLLVEIIQAGR